jgi:hypothetical protein
MAAHSVETQSATGPTDLLLKTNSLEAGTHSNKRKDF